MPPDAAAAPPLHRLLDAAADALAEVLAGRPPDPALARCPAPLRPGARSLVFHALRRLAGAQALRRVLAARRPPARVESLLLLALALLWPDGNEPYGPHVLVDQTVAAAKQRTPASAGFVNAVLRRFLRERETRVAAAQADPEVRWQHPAWWIEQLRADWPAQWQALLAAANRPPPMVLRVNTRRTSVEGALQRLAAEDHAALALGAAAIQLERPCPVDALPGFAAGELSVQDLSAQRAAPLLLGTGSDRLADGARVLDACAAPGGKTAHLLELARLDLLALDRDAQRLDKVSRTLDRLRLEGARLVAADARDPAAWWDGRPFDAILLDAPCTASGIVRRHPDVRWLRRPSDIDALAQIQAELLDALWPLLAPGGRLLYATCSLFRAEGAHQIDAFLQRHAGESPQPDPASPGHSNGVPDNPRSPSPDADLGDGFFYALIRKPR